MTTEIAAHRTDAHCRSCGSTKLSIFLSLGDLPLSDGLLEARQLVDNEPRYPLDVAFCATCSLVQILETVPPEELFKEILLRQQSERMKFRKQVEDAGGVPVPPTAGYLPPAVDQVGGRGMWIARQLADIVSTHTSAGKTLVRMSFPVPVTRSPAQPSVPVES